MSRIHLDLNGRVVFVTGGIGRGFAMQMARDGAGVMVTDLDEATAGFVAEEIRALGKQALGFRVDARSSDEIESAAPVMANEKRKR